MIGMAVQAIQNIVKTSSSRQRQKSKSKSFAPGGIWSTN
jgi:hypothetical protein